VLPGLLMWRAVTFRLDVAPSPPPALGGSTIRKLAASQSAASPTTNASVGGSNDNKSNATLSPSAPPTGLLIEPAQIIASLKVLLPPEQLSTASYHPLGGINVSILELPEVSGLAADDILDIVSNDLLPDLFSRLGAHIVFLLTPAIVDTIVPAPPPPPKGPPTPAGPSQLLPVEDAELNSHSELIGTQDGFVLILAIGVPALFVCLILALLVPRTYRRRQKRLKASTSTMESIPAGAVMHNVFAAPKIPAYVDVVSESSVKTDNLLELSPSILEPGMVNRSISRQISFSRGESARRERRSERTTPEVDIEIEDSDSNPDASDDDEVVGSLERELSGLRETRTVAFEQGHKSRLEQRLEDQRKADLILIKQREEVSEKGSYLGVYDPDSLENRTLVREQALALTLHARRRARERVNAEARGESLTPSQLDPITNSIQRSSITGGMLNASDLHRRGRHSSESDAEPESWLVQVMNPTSATSSSQVPAGMSDDPSCTAASRLARARKIRRSASLLHVGPTDTDGTLNRSLPRSSSFGELPRRIQPRSLHEIRSASMMLPIRKAEPAKLDPLTDALHLATMAGDINDPPPPPRGDWATEQGHLGSSPASAVARLARVRADRRSRLDATTREASIKDESMDDASPKEASISHDVQQPVGAIIRQLNFTSQGSYCGTKSAVRPSSTSMSSPLSSVTPSKSRPHSSNSTEPSPSSDSTEPSSSGIRPG